MPNKSKKDRVWEKCEKTPGENRNVWRKDSKGNKIKYDDYGKHGEYGWDIDHIIPKSKGGTNDQSNLQALHWKANRRKADKHP